MTASKEYKTKNYGYFINKCDIFISDEYSHIWCISFSEQVLRYWLKFPTQPEVAPMTDTTENQAQSPEFVISLDDILKNGAQRLLAQAIEAEVDTLLAQHSELELSGGKRAVVRNGYLPERAIQTGLGQVNVRVPKVRDRSGQGIKFNSALVPPYLRRTQSIDELIPWLYLKGISSGDMQPALQALLGENARGLSANTVSRLKKQWEEDYDVWCQRDLSQKRYVYVWADGVQRQTG